MDCWRFPQPLNPMHGFTLAGYIITSGIHDAIRDAAASHAVASGTFLPAGTMVPAIPGLCSGRPCRLARVHTRAPPRWPLRHQCPPIRAWSLDLGSCRRGCRRSSRIVVVARGVSSSSSNCSSSAQSLRRTDLRQLTQEGCRACTTCHIARCVVGYLCW